MYFNIGDTCYIHVDVEYVSRIDRTKTKHRVLTAAKIARADETHTRYDVVTLDGRMVNGIHETQVVPLLVSEYKYRRSR